MGLIDIVSSDIKNQPGKKDMAIELVKYSVGTMYRISKFVQEQIGVVTNNNSDIEKLLVMSIKMRNIADCKMNKLIDQIELQNTRLTQKGGNHNDDKSESDEIVNLNSNSSDSKSSDSSSNSSIELSRSVSNKQIYNIEDESHFSEILNI